jgi:DNA-binding GntR family transcriptional regulator
VDPVQEQLSRDGTFAARTESRLRDMILGGSMDPGERLNEVAIAQALGISRGPLREAIQRLVGEGLVTVIPHRGSFVRSFERSEVEELYDLRTALEMYVVRLVVKRATDAQVAALSAMVTEAGAALEESSDAAYPADRDFHSLLIEVAGNAILGKAAVEAQRQITLARRASASKPARAREALDEHTALMAAIVRRDEDEAAAQMRLHLDHARRSAVEALGIETD